MDHANEVLRTYRQEHGLSCKEMGDLLGIKESTVRSLENGNRQVTPERAKNIEEKVALALAGRKVRRALTRWQLLPDFFGEPKRRKAAA